MFQNINPCLMLVMWLLVRILMMLMLMVLIIMGLLMLLVLIVPGRAPLGPLSCPWAGDSVLTHTGQGVVVLQLLLVTAVALLLHHPDHLTT